MLKDLKLKQSFTIASIQFWMQFANFSFAAVLIIYLTRPMSEYGIGFSESQAYSFQGVIRAVSIALTMIGGIIVDKYLGLRRSLLLGGILAAISFFFVFISGFFVASGNHVFLIAYTLVPISASFIITTAPSLLSRIYSDDKAAAKSAMTFYHLFVNIPGIFAFTLAPFLIEYKYGPVAILAIVFMGKIIAVTNFSYRYKMFDNLSNHIDNQPITKKKIMIVSAYIIISYVFVHQCFHYPDQANMLLIFIGIICLLAFFLRSILSISGKERLLQIAGLILILASIFYYLIYLQMESTFILVSQNNSDLKLLGLNVAPASYQLINTVVTIIGGGIMVKLYPKITKFYIPYQFATGIVLASLGVASIYMGFKLSDNGIISGNYIGLSYLLIAISELLVVSISMCMVAIYCHPKMIAFAMGAVYVAIGLSSSITGLINKLIAMPTKGTDVLYRAEIYENYFKNVTILCFISAAIVAVGMCVLVRYMKYKKLDFA